MARTARQRPTVLAYYFPNWHADPRNESWFGQGWNEWHLLQAAKQRFPGHRQPRTPMLGYFDEASPRVAETQIALARDHGVDGFLVDYYWYDDGPYLNGALDRGLLKAGNRQDVTFALMWANHQLQDIFPAPTPPARPACLKSGAIDRPAFERMVREIIDRYMSQPNYLTIDGKPWFSIYEIGNFIAGLGGFQQAAEALEWFRQQVIDAGHSGLHLDLVVWGFGVLPEAVVVDATEIIRALDCDSASSYVWVHHADMSSFAAQRASSAALRAEAFREYERLAEALAVPFYPNVTVGWDCSPRAGGETELPLTTYPFHPIWDQTPAEFRAGLWEARKFLERHQPRHPIVTINAWNEWTEGSALLPDTHHGLAFLEAVREVFGCEAGTDPASIRHDDAAAGDPS